MTTVTIPRSGRSRHGRRRRGRWLVGIVLLLAALGAGAWAAWTYLLPKDVDVPRVVGLTVGEAQDRLTRAGFVVRIDEGEYSRRVVADVVLRVQPGEGTTLTEGDRVVLIPSLGPPPVPVPNLIGMTVPEAKEALRDADLRLGKVGDAFSAKFALDVILRQSVRADDEAPVGSAIDVIISKGPAPVAVPNVVGKGQEQAAALLQAFVVEVEQDHSDDVPAGKVISQTPDGGELQPGETVTIVVSLGPPEFPVPNLVGVGKEAAVARLRDLGLQAEVIELPGAVGDLTVASQLPIGGDIVRVGTTITIYVA